ncbi:MAG: CvpA family protein [Hyphomicrobiales bacterium]|nr:CvpA family protein [Hyphomicrobiales bacterium]
MPVSPLDLAVLAIVLVSAFLASVRGFTREVLAIVSWVAAAVAAYLLYPQALPYAKQYISNSTIALIAAIAVVFLLTLIVVALLTVKISDFILDSRIGPLDRSLGFIFGAARGALIALVAFAFFVWLVPEKNQPVWMKDSRVRPLLEPAGESLVGLLQCEDPTSAMGRVCAAMMKGLGKGEKVDAADASGAAPPGPAEPDAGAPKPAAKP